MIDPKRVLAQVALRALQLTGTSQATLEDSYNTADLSTVLDGADIPYSALKHAVVASEAKLAHIIAADALHPYRKDLYGRSDALPSGEEVPSITEEAIPFVGVFSQISDAGTDMVLTEKPIQDVRRFLRGDYKTAIYHYALHGSRIYHTRDSVYFEGCAWSWDLAAARLIPAADDLSPLPDPVEQLWIYDTLSSLAAEGWFIAEASHYAQLAAAGLQSLTNRAAPAIVPSTANVEPVKE